MAVPVTPAAASSGGIQAECNKIGQWHLYRQMGLNRYAQPALRKPVCAGTATALVVAGFRQPWMASGRLRDPSKKQLRWPANSTGFRRPDSDGYRQFKELWVSGEGYVAEGLPVSHGHGLHGD